MKHSSWFLTNRVERPRKMTVDENKVCNFEAAHHTSQVAGLSMSDFWHLSVMWEYAPTDIKTAMKEGAHLLLYEDFYDVATAAARFDESGRLKLVLLPEDFEGRVITIKVTYA